MKRSIILTVALVLCLLALVMSSPRGVRVVKASDPCIECLNWVETRFEECEATHGVGQFCYDQFNNDIVHCYATVCEQ